MSFANRRLAGERLAEKLAGYTGVDAMVVGLPRGGVAVAQAVSAALKLPLDVLVVKKIPSPGQPELGIGALAPDGVAFVDWRLAHRVGADEAYLKTQILHLNEQVRKKIALYRKGKKRLEVREKIVIVVDDGAATGATLAATIQWLRKKKARKIVIALPVAPSDTVGKIRPEVDELVALEIPKAFAAVGQFYEDFAEVTDEEVVALIGQEDNKTGRQEDTKTRRQEGAGV